MKNIFIALVFVLFIAVSALFYLHFSSQQSSTKVARQGVEKAGGENAGSRFAYFDLDSLENRYEYFLEVRNSLRTREDNIASQLNSIRNDYLKLLKEYNQSGAEMSQTQQANMQQKLMKLQNDYQQKEQDLSQDLQNESLKKMQDVRQTIQNYLKDYCSKKGLSFVFAASDNDFLYYKEESLNITKELIEELNKDYAESKKQKSK